MARSTNISPTKRVLMVAANPAVSPRTGWPIGFWWAELTHPFWEFTQAGYDITIASVDGGQLAADAFSDPEHESGYSAGDILSLGFKKSPDHARLLASTARLSTVDKADFDAVFLVGGQGPMYQFDDNPKINTLLASFHGRAKPTAVVCHATVALLSARDDNGALLVEAKTWTGFANSEEDIADLQAATTIQPFRIEDRARKLSGTNFIVHGAFQPHAVRDGHLITGQQQFSGAAAARLVIDALGARCLHGE